MSSKLHGKTKTTKKKTSAHHRMKQPAAVTKDPWKRIGIARGQK